MNFFRNYKAWLILTVVFAVVAGGLSVWLIRSYVGTVKVASALTDLDAGVVVNSQNMVMVDCAKGNLYPDAVRNPSEIAGMVTKGYIPQGTILRKSMFTSPQNAGISGQLTALGKEYRAIAVPNTMSTTVAGTVKTGDRVTIYVVANKGGAYTKLLDNILVLQAGTVKTEEGEEQTSGLVLAMKEKEAETLLKYLPGGSSDASLVITLKPVQSQTQFED